MNPKEKAIGLRKRPKDLLPGRKKYRLTYHFGPLKEFPTEPQTVESHFKEPTCYKPTKPVLSPWYFQTATGGGIFKFCPSLLHPVLLHPDAMTAEIQMNSSMRCSVFPIVQPPREMWPPLTLKPLGRFGRRYNQPAIDRGPNRRGPDRPCPCLFRGA